MKWIRSFEDMKSDLSIKIIGKSLTTLNFIKSYLNVNFDDEYLTNDNLYQVGAFSDKELIGLRIFRMKDDKIHLCYSAVSESWRKKGINKMMYKEIEKLAISNGVKLITSNVRESNKDSMSSLLKCGFSINTNVELRYPDGEKKIPLYKRF